MLYLWQICQQELFSNINNVPSQKVRIVCADVSDGASDKKHDLAYVDVKQLLQVDANYSRNRYSICEPFHVPLT